MSDTVDVLFYHDYRMWLTSFIQDGVGNILQYGKLLRKLHDTPFKFCIYRDVNRAKDGLNLRQRFVQDEGLPSDIFENTPCTVLEMLVALSIRIDDEYIGDPGNPKPGILFWDMIQNLQLFQMVNGRFNPYYVIDILNTWMNREFEPDGRGSIFPLRPSSTDVRTLEIWDQMNAYLSENY